MCQRIFGLVAALLLLGAPACLAAEDLRFVDAVGATGYYVDAASLVFAPAGTERKDGAPNENIVNARVAVVKAETNRRFLYLMRFDREKCTYQLLAATEQAYDTKDVLKREQPQAQPYAYSLGSPLHEIVDFIYGLRAGKKM